MLLNISFPEQYQHQRTASQRHLNDSLTLTLVEITVKSCAKFEQQFSAHVDRIIRNLISRLHFRYRLGPILHDD